MACWQYVVEVEWGECVGACIAMCGGISRTDANPWHRPPTSLVYKVSHMLLCARWAHNCWCSSMRPDSGSKMAVTSWEGMCLGCNGLVGWEGANGGGHP